MADDPVAELYGLPLNDFVPGRNALARDLRKSGDTERAAEVAKLKRPSVAAWAVNQLARRNRKELDLLLDAGHRLRTGQLQAMEKGEQARFDAARQDHDRAVRELVADARELLAGERAATTDQMISSIERTLRYASIDEEHRAELASGTLTTEVEAPGFGAFAGIALPPPQAAAKPKRESAREQKARLTTAQDELKAAQKREREAKRQVAKVEKELTHAREALEAAEAETLAADARVRDVT
jgi:hypothetical protein